MKTRHAILLAVAVLTLAALACGGSSSSPREAGPTSTRATCRAQTFSGRGDEVLELPDSVRGCTKAKIAHDGTANIIVWSYGTGNEQRELLVNDIGHYEGTVKWDQQASSLEIKADGAWSIAFE